MRVFYVSYFARATDTTHAWRQMWYRTSLCAGDDWDYEHGEEAKGGEWSPDGRDDRGPHRGGGRRRRARDSSGGSDNNVSGTSWGRGSSTGLTFMLSDVLSSITEDEAVSPTNFRC